MGTRNESRQGVGSILGLSVKGFKSLHKEHRLEIRPLTILAGANSSGKSSALQPLLLLKQTLDASTDPGPLLLDGPHVRFTSLDQVFSSIGPEEDRDKFSLGIEVEGAGGLHVTYGRSPNKGLEIVSTSHVSQGRTLTLVPEMTQEDIKAALDSFIPPEAKGVPSKSFEAMLSRLNVHWNVLRTRCFLGLGLVQPEPFVMRTAVNPFLSFSPFSPGEQFGAYVREAIHLPALRGNPQRTYKTTGVGPAFPGTFEEYAASVIANWQSVGDSLLGKLGESLANLGLTWKVVARPVDDTRVELRVGRLPHGVRGGAHDLVSIADVGFGVSQVLPVVVALLAAEKGQLVYIEQPEIHLHPRAQKALAEMLADAARRGVRVVAETHSSLLLLGIQTLVAEGRLDRNLVKLYWFQRDKDGATEVASADLDNAGAFGEWPEDFGDVELQAQRAFLDAGR